MDYVKAVELERNMMLFAPHPLVYPLTPWSIQSFLFTFCHFSLNSIQQLSAYLGPQLFTISTSNPFFSFTLLIYGFLIIFLSYFFSFLPHSFLHFTLSLSTLISFTSIWTLLSPSYSKPQIGLNL
jgi:hypothetical protein